MTHQPQPLKRAELLDIRSVLERSMQRAERNKRSADAEQLRREIEEMDEELRGVLA